MLFLLLLLVSLKRGSFIYYFFDLESCSARKRAKYDEASCKTIHNGTAAFLSVFSHYMLTHVLSKIKRPKSSTQLSGV